MIEASAKKTGLKSTKTGWIPEHWSVENLSKVIDINCESIPSDTPDDFLFYYISLSDINKGAINHPKEKISYKLAPERARRKFRKGDILLSTVRPNLQGFAFIDFQSDDYVCSTGFAVLRPKNNSIGRYLYQLLYSRQVTEYFYSCVVGSNYPAINNDDIARLLIPLPPVEEQRKIAEILSVWDRAIGHVQHLVEAKQLLKKNLMQGLVTGKMRFPEFGELILKAGNLPIGWRWMKLDQLLKRVRKPVEVHPEQVYREIGIRSHGKGIFHKEECLGEEIGTKSIFWVEQDCFVLNIVFAWEQAVARITIQEEGMVASHRFPMYRPLEEVLDLDYLVKFFLTPHGKSLLGLVSPGGAGRNKTLSQDAFLKLSMPVPPIDEQKKIVNTLLGLEREIEILSRYQRALQSQKQGLMQRLLTGEIRVKVS